MKDEQCLDWFADMFSAYLKRALFFLTWVVLYFFLCPFAFPLPSSILNTNVQLLRSYHFCLSSICVPFGASISEKRNTQTIYSFIQRFPASSLFAERAGSYLWLVTHHQILRGDCAEHHWFTHSRLCQRSVPWQHSPANTGLPLSRALSHFCFPW